MASLERMLADVFAVAFENVALTAVDPVVRRSQHADFQVDAALGLARTLGRPPREVAGAVLDRVDWGGLQATATVAGPGFINVTVADGTIAALVETAAADERLGCPLATAPQIITIDYSAPNVAKEMHAGHLRSTVIGDAAARLLEWLGHDVRRMNHLGDWGTPFGLLIEHLLDLGETEAAQELSMGDLNAFYQAARMKFDTDPGFAERSRQRVVALQSGDANTRRLWRLLVAESERYFVAIYDRLGVTLSDKDFRGESAYNDMLHPVLAELDRLGLLRDSDGARCAFPPGFTGRDGSPLPIIVRKRDGGFGYGATDLASIRYRTKDLKADRMLYVVGTPQRQHFAMVFAVAAQAGWLCPPTTAEHVGFGQVLGADGKKLKSRAGDSVKLIDLLDEAVSRAAAVVAERSPHLDEATRAGIAEAVGIGAVKFADLSTDRVKDYVFDWDRMLATNGDTAAYLQYACARIHSILRKADHVPEVAQVLPKHPAERALALELLGFPAVIDAVAGTLEFQKLTTYLLQLAGAFTAFHAGCPVLRAESPRLRASRLALCDLTRRTITQGLNLLGIHTPDRM